jgi:YfiH family protein
LAQALLPQWDAHPRVGALMSTRAGGVSVGPWDSLNLGLASGDEAAAVARNRARFEQAIGATPVYLRQVHAAHVVRLQAGSALPDAIQADAAWTDTPGLACTVLVADCLPVLMAAPAGRAVAAAHAGWRGLAGGVLEATLAAVTRAAQCASADVQIWMGPCIGPRQFEVGADVLAAFGVAPERTEGSCFSLRVRADGSPYRHADGHPRWWADLAALARKRLRQAGVERLSGGSWCTVEDASRFFSFRRDRITGRMAAAIWLRD